MKPPIRAEYPADDEERRRAAEICLRCGVCCNVSHSCHAMHDRRFTPTETYVYACLAPDEPERNPDIWLCVSCHKCEEVCPYEVSPVRFIEAAKEAAFRRGLAHPGVKAGIKQIVSTGYAFPISGAAERSRQALNLKPLSTSAAADLAAIAEATGLAEKLKEAQT